MPVTTQQPPLPWKTLANICFALAFCLSCGFLIALANQSHNPHQIDLTCEFLLLPFWLSMMFALSVTTAQGGFDWVAKSRVLQYVWVLSACFALVVVSWRVYYGWDDPDSAILWGLRPLKAVIVALPMTSVIGGVLALNPALSARLSTWLWRAPSAVAGGLSLLVFAAMIFGNFNETQRITASTRRNDASAAVERQTNQLEAVARLDPMKEWAALLPATNIFNPDSIRNLALDKLRTHPNLNAAIAASMSAGECVEVLTYLESSNVPITPVLAEPARIGVRCLAERSRNSLRAEGSIWDDTFDIDTRKVLAVANRFKILGIYLVATVREFRAAMNEPNPGGFVPHCRVRLDAWIAANP